MQYRPWTPDPSWLSPPSPRDWLDDDHLVFFLMDVIAQLELSAIEQAIQSKDPRGNRPFDPRMLAALVLCGYLSVG